MRGRHLWWPFFFYICCMASTIVVYNALKDLVNKEQKGFINASVFNSLADIAQRTIFNEMMTELVEGKKIARNSVDVGNRLSYRERKIEDLSPFIILDAVVSGGSSNSYPKPTNLFKIISIRNGAATPSNADPNINDVVGEYELLYDVSILDSVRNSRISGPTRNFPVALIADKIYVYPVDTDQILISYYRQPGSYSISQPSNFAPIYVNSVINGIEFADPINTRDFMLPDHYVPEIVSVMAEMVGVHLRDGDVLQYSQAKAAAE
jgi:hypothetical protein